MCSWYKLGEVVNGKTLFQYTLDYKLNGFQVSFLVGSGLIIRYGGSDKLIIVRGISTKLDQWTHLCISGKKGRPNESFKKVLRRKHFRLSMFLENEASSDSIYFKSSHRHFILKPIHS